MNEALVRRDSDGWLRARYRRSGLGRALTRAGDRLMQRHVEYNFDCVAPHIPDGSRLLDVGAWDCRVSRLFRDRLGCDVTAADVVDKNRTDVPLVVYDGARLPFDDDSFDVVTILYVLHHAADDGAILAEAARVCRPGGRILIAEDQAETRWEKAIAIGFHVWLLSVTFMGWKGSFRTIDDWRARMNSAGIGLDEVTQLGPHLGKRLWPRNVLLRGSVGGDSCVPNPDDCVLDPEA
jgi:SAM-dependent methyltransferase